LEVFDKPSGKDLAERNRRRDGSVKMSNQAADTRSCDRRQLPTKESK
jgi:hypothetical protein